MRDRTRFSILLTALLLATACSDDNKDGVEEDGGVRDGSVLPGADGSVGIDGGGTVVDMDGSIVLPDGAVVMPDGAVVMPDGAVVLPDGAVVAPDGAVVEPDGAVLVPDASVVEDAGAGADASGMDATTVPDASGPCDVNDPTYGCGTLSGTTWVSFPDFEVDLTNKVAWTKPVEVLDDDALKVVCAAATNGGFQWRLPQMQDVRPMAAGCPETVVGGSCQVNVDMVLTSQAGDCECDPSLVGPNDGKFCKPDVPECDVLWVWTHTDETGYYQHWFYDVETGSIVHDYVGVGIALKAKGRCVHDLADNELPALLAP